MAVKYYKIESDVPFPARLRSDTQYRHPLKLMSIGDSYFVDDISLSKIERSIWPMASRLKIGVIFDKENKGVRVWRIK